MKNFSKVILFVVAISSSLRAVPMLTDRGESIVESKKQSSDEVTAAARRNEETKEEGESEQKRGIMVSANDPTVASTSLRAESPLFYGSMGINLSELIMPKDCSFFMRKQFAEDLQEVKKLSALEQSTASKKRIKNLIFYWQEQGVEMDRQYIQNTIACYKKAKKLTANISRLKDQAEQSFCETLKARENYYSAIHDCENLIKAALQTAQTWQEAAIMCERIPSSNFRQGAALREGCVREARQWKLNRKKAIEELFDRVEETTNKITEMVDKIPAGFEILNSDQNNAQQRRLSDACKKVIAIQRVVDLAKKNLVFFDANTPVNRNLILSLEMALNASGRTIDEAESLYNEMMTPQKADIKLEGGDKISADSKEVKGDLSLSFEEAGKSNNPFEQQAKLLDDYVQKTLDAAYGAFLFFNDNAALSSEADSSDLVDACDTANGLRAVLAAFEATRNNKDPWLQEKQELATSNLEQAIQQVYEIALRLKNEDRYEKDQKKDAMVTYLQQLKEEYAIALATISEE